MIALTCPYCRHETNVSPAGQERGFPCPNCGRFLPQEATSEGSITLSGRPSGGFAAPTGNAAHPRDPSDQTTPSQRGSSGDATVAGNPAGPIAEFSFLAPALGPDELGWLAHYKVVRLLGQGGMGVVFEAVDTKLQRTVALKVMRPDIAKDDKPRLRFLREARATASLKSDFIVVIHDVDQFNDIPYLAMEFLSGEPLDLWMQRCGRPSLAETLHIGIDVARGLASAHERGLIHRDIKPSNIWREIPSGRAKILDFGLARNEHDAAQLTQSGLILGTPAYMAPEQAEDSKVDGRSDLFSLGCVLYELATGQQAFKGASTMAVLMAVATKDPTPPRELREDIPPALSDLVLGLLAKNPADRPASALETAAALEAIAREAGIGCQPPSTGVPGAPAYVPPRKPSSAWRFLWPVAGIVVIVGIVAAASVIGWRMLQDRSEEKTALERALRATARGVTDQEILLGMSGPLNGPSAEIGREMELGLKTYFRVINEQGGVHGRKVRLVALDDEYDPAQALANMKEFLEERKVFAVIGNAGTPTAIETLPYAIKNELLFLGAFTGTKLLRKDPPDRYVFNFRASYEEETEAIVRYLVRIRKVRPEQIAVFAQNDLYGDDGFNGVVKALRGFGRDRESILRVGFERNTIQVQDAVDKILADKEIRAVVMVSTYKPATLFIQKLKDAKRDLIFTNVSFVGSQALAGGLLEIGPDYADEVIVTQVVPPIDSSASAVLKYREHLHKYYPGARPNFTSLEGYLSATFFVEGLKKAGVKLTTDTMIDALEKIHEFDIGFGAPLTFGPSRHQASRKVWATKIDKTGTFQVLDLEE